MNNILTAFWIDQTTMMIITLAAVIILGTIRTIHK